MKGKKYNYELVLVLKPKADEATKEVFFKKIGDFLDALKVSIATKDNMGQKDLAYEIKHLRKGDFWVLGLVAEAGFRQNEFNLLLNRDPLVIRYLMLKK